MSFVQKSDILSAGLAVQGMPDEGALKMAKTVGKKLSEAGIGYVCEKAKREQGIVMGEHPASALILVSEWRRRRGRQRRGGNGVQGDER